MQTYADKPKKTKSAENTSAKQNTTSTAAQFKDNRSNTNAQRDLLEMAGNNARATKMAQLKGAKRNGLPEQLKTGIESLSGMDMSDVTVHKNSSKPAQLNALAYAQGSEIHLGSGQEQHLAHEAWHVVQQRQGRVKPTTQMGGVAINDNESLEKEADVMGAKAAAQRMQKGSAPTLSNGRAQDSEVSQKKEVSQRKSVPGLASYGNFTDLGSGKFGTTQPTNAHEVAGLVNAIRAKADETGQPINIKILTGTHGDVSGNLVGETVFYNEDLVHEGHDSGWTNVLNVNGKPKATIGGWKEPGSSAVILAWCYSKASDQNWDAVHSYKTAADYHNNNPIW